MKEKFIKSTIILIIGGGLTKLLGMIIKIIATRIIGTEGIGMYMLILPTFNLFITLCTLSLPVAISKVIAEDKVNNKTLIFSLIPIIILVDIFLIILIIITAPYISSALLHDNRLYYPILAISITLPFISLSSIARGYFFGKEKMFPHTLSNVFEQIVRLIILVIILPKLINKNLTLAVTGMVLVNVISELASIFILFLFLPKNFKLEKKDFKLDFSNLKDIFSVSIPTTFGRLIGSVGYFFEPIILTFFLLKGGYSNNYIVLEYGILSGYVMPLLLMPSFLSLAISSALLPVISKYYSSNRIDLVKRKIKQASLISLIIGSITTVTLFLFPSFFLKIIYNTNQGTAYLRILAFPFIILYLQSPLAAALQAINKSKKVMYANLVGIIIKLVLISILSLLDFGMYSLVIATIFNIIFITTWHFIDLKKDLKYNK